MNAPLRALLTIISLVPVAACGRSPPPPTESPGGTVAEAAAHQAHAAYGAAINSNNLESLVAMFTDDVVFMAPNEPAVVGKPAVRAWSEAYLKAYKIHWDKSAADFIVAGDFAIERYAYRQRDVPAAGGAEVTDTGKGIIVYHHDTDGTWRVAQDAWNSDLPVPVK